MSKCKIKQTNYLRTNSTRKNYLSESSDDFDETFEDTKTPTMIDDDNSIIKPSHSLDDLLDIDDNNNNQNVEHIDETENDDDDDDDDDDSIQLSIDDTNTTKTTRQKKSNKKKGKL
jgi:hypothetical protein